jgi:hypothetical protein
MRARDFLDRFVLAGVFVADGARWGFSLASGPISRTEDH